MRAKLRVTHVEKLEGVEVLTFGAVSASSYPEDGSDENNTFAKFTPSADLKMSVTNTNLHGQFVEGDEYYVDFTKVAKAVPEEEVSVSEKEGATVE